MAEATSVTTFVIENRLPWPEEMAASDISGPFDAGTIHSGSARRPCAVRRISALGATLRGEVEVAVGEDIAVELANGQRPQAKVEWAKGGEAGIVFCQPVDMIALVNRNLIAQPADRRAMPRVELRALLHLKWGATLAPARLRNISAQGMQIEGEDLPQRGTFVSLFIEGLNMPPGEVVWRKGDVAGIELLEELSWSSIIPWVREFGRKAA